MVTLMSLFLLSAHAQAPALEQARNLLQDGQSEQALETLRPLLTEDDPAALGLAAHIRLDRGEVSRARLGLEQSVSLSPAPETHRDLARCYLALGDHERALAQVALAAQSGAEDTHRLLAQALVLIRPADTAEEILSGLYPDAERTTARIALADAYMQSERYRDAIQTWQQAIDSAPMSPMAPTWQARIVESQRRRGQMQAELDALSVLLSEYGRESEWGQSNPDAREDADAIIGARIRDALDQYSLDVQMMPRSAAATRAMHVLGQLYGAWLDTIPADARTTERELEYATLLSRQGRHAEAHALYEEAYQSDPDGPRAALALQNAAHAAGQLLHMDAGAQRQWLPRLLWAADEHHLRFADQTEDALVQWRAAEGLLLAGQEEDALARMHALIQRWPASRTAPHAARRILDIHIRAQDWARAHAAALAFSNQPELGDDSFQQYVSDIISDTEGR